MQTLDELLEEQRVADLAADEAAQLVEATPEWAAYLAACGRAQDARARVQTAKEAAANVCRCCCGIGEIYRPNAHDYGGITVYEPGGDWAPCRTCNGTGKRQALNPEEIPY